ncbi:MAG: LytTR family DNA-binding domain-containing protein [Pseudomonadota bacterium]
MERLDHIQSLSEIICVKAEEHYVRVRSEYSEELIAYRFGLALKDLADADGFQVHRSYWVRRDAVKDRKDTGGRIVLIMNDDTEIPVSQPYHALTRQVL